MADRTCSLDGCTRPYRARGMCGPHYNAWHRQRARTAVVCSVADCARPAHARSWCKKHYRRWLRNGDPRALRYAPDGTGCGTNSAYSRGCRCIACQEAHASYGRAWRKDNIELRRKSRRAARARLRGAASEPYTTEDILERDGWRCGICRRVIGRTLAYPHPRSPSIDHVLPLAVGGADTRDNVQAAHLVCNVSKGAHGAAQLRLVG